MLLRRRVGKKRLNKNPARHLSRANLTFGPNGYLYGMSGQNQVRAYDVYTGLLVRDFEVSVLEFGPALAFVPEPATLILLGLGGIALRRKKRC